MPEKRDIEINSRADTIGLMDMDVRPYPVTPPPSYDQVKPVYERRKALEFCDWAEDSLRFEKRYGKDEALAGLRVLDIGLWRLGHKFCASMFGEAGAEVVSIEPPSGDPLRKLTPFGREEYMLQNRETGEKCGMEFVNETVNTHCVTLDVETEAGREIFKKMAQNVDVLIDGMPPGYMDGLGIGYRQLKEANPRMVYVWVGMMGQWGPWKDKQSKFGQWELEPFASCANSWVHNTGLAQDLLPRGRGGDPTRSGIWLADYVAGGQGFVNALAALYWRDELGGTGQMIDVTGAETLMDILDFDITWYGFNASVKARSGGWDPNLNQYAWNPCKDGYMMIGGQTDKLWYNIGFCLEREFTQFGRLIHEDPFLKEMGARNALHALIKTYSLTARWLRDTNRVEAETKLLEYQLAAGPVMFIDEVCEFPHFKYRPWIYVHETDYGPLLIASSPSSYQLRAPFRCKWMGRDLGADNYEIYLKWTGMTQTTVNAMKQKGVI
jgi:crotonobetainyl-CoA:carnitine CoA-transferase CaiB-like acyl-CoA transferase